MSDENKMVDLMPCQCGGAVAFHSGEGCDGCHYIHCSSCGAMVDYSSAVDPTNSCQTLDQLRALCAETWNRRSLPVGVPDGLLTRIDSAIKAFTSGRASMHVPPEPDDVDMVLGECWKLVNALIAAPTVKAEQVQCEPTELALLREYRASAMAFSLAHGPDVSLPAFDKAEKRLEAAEKACHDFYAGRTPSLPAAGSAVEDVEVVAYRYHCTDSDGNPIPNWYYSDDAGSLGLREPLMTVAQHNRIVAALSAQQSAPERVSVPVLTDKEREDLLEFHEAVCCDAGHRVEKDGMRRLAEIGAVQPVGFGRHRLTEFGIALLASHGRGEA